MQQAYWRLEMKPVRSVEQKAGDDVDSSIPRGGHDDGLTCPWQVAGQDFDHLRMGHQDLIAGPAKRLDDVDDVRLVGRSVAIDNVERFDRFGFDISKGVFCRLQRSTPAAGVNAGNRNGAGCETDTLSPRLLATAVREVPLGRAVFNVEERRIADTRRVGMGHQHRIAAGREARPGGLCRPRGSQSRRTQHNANDENRQSKFHTTAPDSDLVHVRGEWNKGAKVIFVTRDSRLPADRVLVGAVQ